MVTWTSIIKSVEPFVAVHNPTNDLVVHTDYFTLPTKFGAHDEICAQHGMIYVENLCGRSAFVRIDEPATMGEVAHPSAPSPAPAQMATRVMITFGTPVESPNSNSMMIKPTISDLPNVIAIINLRKWYTKGVLHRKGVHPALRADYVGVAWVGDDGLRSRVGGPHAIGIEDYQEFYTNGRFSGRRYGTISTVWDDKLVDAAKNIVGETNPFSTQYCQDVQDKFMISAYG